MTKEIQQMIIDACEKASREEVLMVSTKCKKDAAERDAIPRYEDAPTQKGKNTIHANRNKKRRFKLNK